LPRRTVGGPSTGPPLPFSFFFSSQQLKKRIPVGTFDDSLTIASAYRLDHLLTKEQLGVLELTEHQDQPLATASEEITADSPQRRLFQNNFVWLELFLRKFTEISLLASLLAVPLIYHFSLPIKGIQAIRQLFGNTPFCAQQIEPFFTGVMPTLESKFSAWAVLGLLTIFSYIPLRLFQHFISPWSDEPKKRPSLRTPFRLYPLLALAFFLIYALASFLLWAPEPPIEAARYLTQGNIPSNQHLSLPQWLAENMGGGGFFYSVTAWLQVVFCAFFFLIAEDMIRSRRFVVKILALIVFTGLLNAVFVILLKVQFPPLMEIWIRFGETDLRNSLGAFIGHNTGVASFIATPLLICLGWVLGIQPHPRQTIRVALIASISLMFLALLLTQSRAIIPILIFTSALLVYLLYKRSSLLLSTKIYIWLPVFLAFGLLTQLIPSRMNLLYRRDITLVKRLEDFTPEKLLTETRLRILTVSLNTLIPESPIIGHGFASFQYIYPKAQGEYYQANPDSPIAPTPLRTQRAHNEYLQLLIETGVIGLSIVLLGLFFLLRGGWNTLKRSLMPHHIAVQTAIFCSICTILLHSGVDFPLRIPPIALTLVFLLAIWSAGDRLWLFPMNPPQDPNQKEKNAEKPEDSQENNPAKKEQKPNSLLLWITGSLMTLLGLGAFVGLCVITIAPFQSAAVMTLRGEQLLKLYHANRQFKQYLESGMEDIRWAKRIYWISGPINRLDAQTYYYAAQINYQRSDHHAKQNNFNEAVKLRALAKTFAETGISNIDMALTDEQFHTVYLLRSTMNQLIADNSLGEERTLYNQAALEDLVQAVEMNPGDPEALLALITELEQTSPSLRHSEIIHHLKTLEHFHPTFFNQRYFDKVLVDRAFGNSQRAYERMDLIQRAIPGSPLYTMVFSAVSMDSGKIKQAVKIANALLENIAREEEKSAAERESATLILAQAEIIAGRNEAALGIIEPIDKFQFVDRPFLLAMKRYLLSDSEEDRKQVIELENQIKDMAEESPMAYVWAGMAALSLFDNPQEAVKWLEMRKRLSPSDMDIQAKGALARSYGKLEQWDKLPPLIQELRKGGGNNYTNRVAWELANTLEQQMQQAKVGEEALPEE
jgi:O-Antigen ligase